MGGKSDPYATVGLGGRKTEPLHKQARRTATISDNLNPGWDEEFEVDVYSRELQFLWVQCYDEDDYSADDKLGEVVLPLMSYPPLETVEASYPLKFSAAASAATSKNKDLGEVTLEIMWIPEVRAGGSRCSKLDNNPIA